ncbi:MAG: class I SAM-dependent methyltransferase [Bacteroidia bacterium]|nr:class I SAM-dependent methyltransferase [Bacteroidia bacterium]
MRKKIGAIILFPCFVIKYFKVFLKILFHFIEAQKAKEKVARLGYPNGIPTIELKDLVPELNARIEAYTFLDGTSPPLDIALLQMLARSMDNPAYLEIGSWRGESLWNVAPYCSECVSVSLSKDEMRALGYSENAIEQDGLLLDSIPNLKRIMQNSLTFDFTKLNKKFDLIFVDGDHSYEGVLNDTRKVFGLLKNENSAIVWHDAGHGNEGFRWEVLAGILEGIPEEKRKHVYRVSNTLCAIYILKPLSAEFVPIPKKPKYFFNLNIEYKR